jgi:Flp pilus assembly protein TadD
VLYRRGQLQEARRWLERAASLPGGADDPTVWDHLGDLYVKLEEPARARTAWQKALLSYAGEKRRKDEDHGKEVERKLKRLGAEKQHP